MFDIWISTYEAKGSQLSQVEVQTLVDTGASTTNEYILGALGIHGNILNSFEDLVAIIDYIYVVP